MGNVIHHHRPAKDITCRADSAIVAGTFVVLAGAEVDGLPLVRTAGAGARPYGVAISDQARGENVLVTRGGTLPILAGGSITAGDDLSSDASGRAVRATAVDFDNRRAATFVAAQATTTASSAEMVRGTLTLGA